MGRGTITTPPVRPDGGPTSWKANIITSTAADSYRWDMNARDQIACWRPKEERVGSEADGAPFLAGVLQLLRDHRNEIEVPVSGATERVVISILRAVVDLGLACGAGPRSTEKRAMRAVCGYLCYGLSHRPKCAAGHSEPRDVLRFAHRSLSTCPLRLRLFLRSCSYIFSGDVAEVILRLTVGGFQLYYPELWHQDLPPLAPIRI
jgi:hypothetical protein